MLAFVQTGYTVGGTTRIAGTYYQFTSADARNVNTGELPNTEANWAVFPSGSGSSQWEDTSNGIYYNQPNNTVIVGKSTTDSTNGYSMDISGTLYTDNLIAQSYETFSDMRLKCNISSFNMTDRVLSLGTFAYNYISNSTVTEIGLLAQEVERVAPEIVREQCGYKTIQYDRIPILLLPVIKQQQQQIIHLEEQIRILKAAVGIR
jgi:energy-coupling factor transporter ATP-binding protein EcfA2